MAAVVPGVLSRIVEQKRKEVSERAVNRARLEARAAARTDRRRFAAGLQGRGVAIIAEVKKASPSKGVLVGEFEPARLAATYERGGAAAVSVLTDEQFFQGSLGDLEAARAACGLPVLRKDFTIDEYHVVEAAAHGADAILLIAAILTVEQMRRYRELAEGYGMDALVEVHDGEELERALASGARMVGVNNRNLHDFTVRLETSLELAERMPADVLRVSESGIGGVEDIRRLRAAGYGAFLVGEYLMKSGDAAGAIEALRQG